MASLLHQVCRPSRTFGTSTTTIPLLLPLPLPVLVQVIGLDPGGLSPDHIDTSYLTIPSRSSQQITLPSFRSHLCSPSVAEVIKPHISIRIPALVRVHDEPTDSHCRPQRITPIRGSRIASFPLPVYSTTHPAGSHDNFIGRACRVPQVWTKRWGLCHFQGHWQRELRPGICWFTQGTSFAPSPVCVSRCSRRVWRLPGASVTWYASSCAALNRTRLSFITGIAC